MKRKIIKHSPILYNFICFIINLVLWLIIILVSTLPFILSEKPIPVWVQLILIFSWTFGFWCVFLLHKKNKFYEWYTIPFINLSTATSKVFINLHKDQKTKELDKGFKLIKIFGTFTSWFWLFTLISRKDKNVIKVIKAFKKFINSNEKIYRLVDIKKNKEMPPIEINYIVIDI